MTRQRKSSAGFGVLGAGLSAPLAGNASVLGAGANAGAKFEGSSLPSAALTPPETEETDELQATPPAPNENAAAAASQSGAELAAKPQRTYIARDALDRFVTLYRNSFVDIADMGAALNYAAKRFKDEVTIEDGPRGRLSARSLAPRQEAAFAQWQGVDRRQRASATPLRQPQRQVERPNLDITNRHTTGWAGKAGRHVLLQWRLRIFWCATQRSSLRSTVSWRPRFPEESK